MTALLDINVLIALLDEDHVYHATATRFLQKLGAEGWATCPLTENGLLRILGRPIAQGWNRLTRGRADGLSFWCDYRGHQFWLDDVSLMNR
jgi:uncharacterized protein